MYKSNIKIEREDVTELHFGCINVTCIDGAIIYREPDADNPKDFTARFASLSDNSIKNIEITFYREEK